ncbi:MAG: hypothetical protein J6V36_01305 [Clostridia bacterium]|nr:hypothetical protein [Clostridia bacterium]
MLRYDMTIKFESEIFVKTFDKDFEIMLSNLGGTVSHFGKTAKVEHVINIANSPVLPDEKIIEILKNNIFEALTETFQKQNSLNVDVKGVNFIGIMEIQQKEG